MFLQESTEKNDQKIDFLTELGFLCEKVALRVLHYTFVLRVGMKFLQSLHS